MHDVTRSLLSITGEDAESFLQGLVTQDVSGMAEGEMRFGALLSPQGKWQHDFFITRVADGFALDTAENTRASLQQKLAIYKLRAKLIIAHDTSKHLYYLPPQSSAGTADPRDVRLPKRAWLEAAPDAAITREGYDLMRASLFVPEGGIEVTTDETAMDASYDMLHGIHFTKGCYVGQEVTARMHYKSITRKGFFGVRFAAPVAIICPVPVLANGKTIATLRSVHGENGIAYGKFEDAAPLFDGAARVQVESHDATLIMPDWQVDKYARFAHEKNS